MAQDAEHIEPSAPQAVGARPRDDADSQPSAARPRRKAGWRTVVVCLIVATSALAFGWPSRNGEFLSGDDYHFIVEHALVNHPSLSHALRLLTIVHGDLYQPVPMLTFLVDYALAASDAAGRFPVSPAVFHATNITLHVLNAIMACLLGFALTRSRGAGLLVGCMFACHPFAVEPVAWISGRMILLATTFSLLLILLCSRRPHGSRASDDGRRSACRDPADCGSRESSEFASDRSGLRASGSSVRSDCCVPQGGQRANPCVSANNSSSNCSAQGHDAGRCGLIRGLLVLLSWLLALGSKVLPTVPVAAVIADRHLHGKLSRTRWAGYGLLFAIGLVATVVAAGSSDAGSLVDQVGNESATSIPVRLLLAARYHLENYVWPTRLAAWTPPPKHVPLLSTEAGIAALECAAFCAVLAWARRRHRVAFVGLLTFAVLLAPMLAATTARRALTADRYMYLPILGLHVALASCLLSLRSLRGSRNGPSTSAAQAIGDAVPPSPSQNRQETTPELRLAVLPPAGLPHRSNCLADLLLCAACAALLIGWMRCSWRHAAVYANTVCVAQRTVDLYPADVDAWAELARAENFAGRPDAALQVIREAKSRWPKQPRLAAEAGKAHLRKGDLQQAAAELKAALDDMPQHVNTRYEYARVLEQSGRPEAARTEYKTILDQAPSFLPAWTALARNHRHAGEISQAMACFERAVALNAYDRDARFELALLLIRQQRWSAAEQELEFLVQLDSQDREAAFHLAVALAHDGASDKALALYDRLLREDPFAVAARVNRAGLLDSLGRTADAEADYREVLALAPDRFNAATGLHELLQRQRRFDEMVRLWKDFRVASDAPTDGAAWLAWAYSLAGKAADAQQTAHGIDAGSRSRSFADWALAFAALRDGDSAAMRRWLGQAVVLPTVPPERLEQARVIMLALSDLPEDIRQSPAGLYALARALAYEGRFREARSVARRMLDVSPPSEWVEAANELTDGLELNGAAR